MCIENIILGFVVLGLVLLGKIYLFKKIRIVNHNFLNFCAQKFKRKNRVASIEAVHQIKLNRKSMQLFFCGAVLWTNMSCVPSSSSLSVLPPLQETKQIGEKGKEKSDKRKQKKVFIECISLNPITLFLPFTQKIFLQPIPKISWLFSTFGCGYFYEFFCLHPLTALLGPPWTPLQPKRRKVKISYMECWVSK